MYKTLSLIAVIVILTRICQSVADNPPVPGLLARITKRDVKGVPGNCLYKKFDESCPPKKSFKGRLIKGAVKPYKSTKIVAPTEKPWWKVWA